MIIKRSFLTSVKQLFRPSVPEEDQETMMMMTTRDVVKDGANTYSWLSLSGLLYSSTATRSDGLLVQTTMAAAAAL